MGKWILTLVLSLSFAVPVILAQTAATDGGASAPASEVAQLKRDVEGLKAQIKALEAVKFECSDGKSVQGPKNKWSPWSACPNGMIATGLARVDIQGDHEVVTNHVNDFQCGAQGCRAWCIGNPCEVIARCCK